MGERRGNVGRNVLVVAVVALVAVAVAVAIKKRSAVPPPTVTAPPAPTAAPASADAGPPVAATGPVLDDAEARTLVERVSSDPFVKEALGREGLIRRWVAVTANLVEGVSPAPQIPFLRPRQPFTVARSRGVTVISPQAYARYDTFGLGVASLDVGACVTLYRAMRPALEVAYRALGYPEASIDDVTARALRRLERAPVKEGEVVVEADGGLFLFAEPELEGLGGVEKHLLRMGPRNTRSIQAKARELLEALGLGARGQTTPGGGR